MKLFGLYPPEKPTRLFRIRSYLLYFVILIPVPALGALYIFLEEDQTRIGDNGFVVAETACVIIKLMPFVVNGSQMKRCIHYLEDSSFEVAPDNRKILEKSIYICRRNSKVFIVSIVVGNISFNLKPFLGEGRILPVDVWFPCSPTENTKIYCIIFLMLSLGIGYMSLSNAAIDPLIGGLCCLASGHLQVLKNNLQNLHTKSAESSSDTMKRNIKKCVKYHSAILSFIKEYERCFSSIVFSQFLASVVVVCFCCLQLNKLPPMTITFFNTVGYLIVFLAEIYFYCYYGTILYEESNSLSNAIYMGNWYDYDINSKKDLIFLMERSKRPISVTAGKILDLSVDTFVMILQRSYSLLAVLKNQ
ncbi:hypothetical protein Zmor_002379 [Zophobas morio]|uniref:Odorant receptor n=2 Tax=Zophobas morio TaxID=2755281 RepID=A0AA38J4T4_9CUCU|nr:hypothetical protein Zmor_002379 [Zophobas morio]